MNSFEGNLLNKPKPNQINKTRNTSVGNPSTLYAQPQYTQPKSGWYAGDQPTASETIAQIYKVGKDNPDVLSQLNDMFNAEIMNPESNLYQPYLMPTTDKVNDTNIRNTNNAMNEWNQLQAELAYWANRADRNYSDDEIINRIDMAKYPTLAKMDAYKNTGVTMELLAPVGYSRDAMYGVLWSARNGGQTSGNYLVDAAQGIMGNGNKYQRDEALYGRRDATSDNYAPYTVGATALDDLSYKYGMQGDFTEEWLNGAGRALLNGDAQAKADYTRIYNTVMNTKKLNEEAALFNDYVQKAIESGVDPAKFFTDEFESDMKEDYPELYKALDGQRSGKLYETSGAVGFDYNKAKRDMKANWDRVNGNVTPDQMDAAMSAEFGLPDSKDEAQKAIDQQEAEKEDNAGWLSWMFSTEDERLMLETKMVPFTSSKSTGAKVIASAGAATDAPHRTAMNAANAYAGEFYLNAKKIHDGLVAEFYGNDAMRSLLETYFPEHAANGTVPSLNEFVALEESNEESYTAVFQAGKFFGNVGEKLKQLDNEKKILKGVDERYKLAEELGQGGSARDFLNFVYQFDGYEAQPMTSVAVWSPQQYKQNSELIAMFEDYISKAEELKVPAEYVDGLRAAVGELQTNNYLMEASKLKYVGDFGEKVKEFDETQTPYYKNLPFISFDAPSADEIIHAAIIDPYGLVEFNEQTVTSVGVVQKMTENEKNTYKYIFVTDGAEAAKEYYDNLEPSLHYRKYNELAEEASSDFENAGEAIGKNVGSVLMNSMAGFTVLAKAIRELSGEKISQYDPINWSTMQSQQIRESSKRQINEQLGEGSFAASLATFGYDAGMASLDSMTSALLGGGSTGGLVLMGGAAMDSALMDAEMRGAEGVQKWVYAGAVAAAEVLTEKLPMDALADALKSGSVKSVKEFFAGALKQLGKGFITDAPGEMLSEFFGEMADQIIMDEMANYAARFEQLVNEEGLSPAEAQLVADREVLSNMLYAFALGGVSAGGSNVAAYTVGSVFGGNENEDGGSETKPTEEQPANEQKTKNKWVAAAEEMAEAETAADSSSEQTNEATAEVPETVQNDPVKSAEAVLAKAESLGTGTAESAGLIASVMEGVAGMDSMEADAAARTIAAKWKDPLFTTRRMIRNSPDAARTLHAMELAALVPDSQTAEAINTMVESGEVTPEAVDIVNTVYEQEMSDNGLRERLDAKIASMATAETTVGLVAQSDLDAIKKLDAEAAAAKAQMKKVQDDYDSMSKRVNADMAALDSAREAFYANLNDESVKDKYLQAFERYRQDSEKMFLENDNLAAAKKNYADAKAKAKTGTTEMQNRARVEAKAQVAQRMEQRRAELEAIAQQEAQAAETKRQNDNVLALQADDFVNTYYANAPADVKAKIREQYMAYKGETKNVTRDMTQFASQISKKFKLKITFTDSHGIFEGAYMGGNRIVLDKNATQGDLIKAVLTHEIVHAAETSNEYNEFADAVLDAYYQGNTEQMQKDIDAEEAKYSEQAGQKGVGRSELVAKRLSNLLNDNPKALDRLIAEKPNVAQRIWQSIKDFIAKMTGVHDQALDTAIQLEKKLEKALRGRNVQNTSASVFSTSGDTTEANALEDVRPSLEEAPVNEKGAPLRYSLTTYNQKMAKPFSVSRAKALGLDYDVHKLGANGRRTVVASGRDVTKALMQKEDFDNETIGKVLGYVDHVSKWFENAVGRYEYVNLQDVNDASIIIDHNTGEIKFSCQVPNSEYKVNFDFTTVCRQREAVQRFVDELASEKGANGTRLDDISLTPQNIFKLNTILKNEGYETACLGCFVEAKRYRIKQQAETLCQEWNDLVLAQNPDAEYFGFSTGETDLMKMSNEEVTKLEASMRSYNTKGTSKATDRAARLVNIPEMQKLIRPGDIISRQGRQKIRAFSPALESFLVSRFGQGGAKPAVGFMPYNSEIASLPDTKKVGSKRLTLQGYLRMLGGARSNSFSDYVPSHALDYLQRTVDMATRRLTAQCYTKVPGRARTFGMTGEKINMSVMFDIDPTVHWSNAGLDAAGDYLVGDKARADKIYAETGERPFTQSFPWADAVAIEHDPRYADSCGIIGVGYSYNHIAKMMSDDNVPYIIPYHRSSMPESVAKASNTKHATNYEPVQNNTRVTGYAVVTNLDEGNGTPSFATWPEGKKKTSASDLTWDMKAALQRNGGNAKAAIAEWHTWMQENDLTPVTSTAEAGHGKFDMYADLEATKDPAATAENYMKYCLENDMLPVFYEFANTEGYDKHLFDFSVRNLNTGEVALQKNLSFDFMDSVSAEEFVEMLDRDMSEYNEYNQEQFYSEKWNRVKETAYNELQTDARFSLPSTDILNDQIARHQAGATESNENAKITLSGDMDADVATVREAALKAHGEFVSRVGTAIDGFGAFLDGGVKSENSLKNKVLRKQREGREYTLLDPKDHVRGAVMLDKGLQDVPAVLKRLKEQFPTLEGEAFLLEPLNSSGYRGIHLSVTFDNGIKGEIQMTTPEAWSIKKQTDEIYEKWRNVSLEEASPQQIADYKADYKRSAQMWEDYYSGFTPEVIRNASDSVMGLESSKSPNVPDALTHAPSLNSNGAELSSGRIAYSLPSSVENSQDIAITSDAIVPQNGAISQRTIDGRNLGERQFVAKTLPGNPNIPQWAVEGMQNNPEARYYEKDTNRAQLIRAWQRIQENGVEAERDRLANLESYTADDSAEANLLMAMSLREDTSDPATFFQLALTYTKTGTETAKDLQVRKLFSKMTPDGARIWAAGKSEQALESYLDGHTQYRDKINQRADKVSGTIRNMQSGDQLLRLNAGGDFTIDSTNNKWGVPLNEQQLALIEQYGLQNEARPGIFYNRATIKQRMLEAIIATPNPLEVTNLGLTLIHRLEMMKDGKAVVTNADLNYIGQRLGEFMGLGQDAGGRAADVALARAYEAFGNITPASGWEKFRTQRYVNMLLSLPTFTRNIMGNALQNALNAASHGIAVELDKFEAKKTGRRTLEHLSVEERVNGWKAFAEETKNTFKDFFIDKVDAAPNKEKYSTNRKGRTFQNNMQEGMKNIEAFMMSFGDRNVWKKAFVNSMAEQQKLADRGLLYNDNGTTRTHEQMVEKAEEAAAFATFTEKNFVQELMGSISQKHPRIADIVSIYLPFTGVPSNIMTRSMQYSPMGLLWAVGKRGYQHVTKQNFDQQKFVEGVARGLTGTAMLTVGALLGAAGFIRMGTEDDESNKVYDANTAMGNQYTPYVYDPITDTYVSLSTFAPAFSPLVWGASVAEALKGDDNLFNIFINALSSSTDSILEASYLSGISDIFGGYGSTTENIVDAGLENITSQMIPALITQTANALDPYVRETKDKDKLVELLKKTVNKIPGLRNVLLPEKITVAGENVLTKPGASNYVDPFTRTNPSKNEALIEAMRLYEVLGTTDVLPSDALRSRTNSFSLKVGGVKMSVTLNDKQKEEYKKYYGDLWTSRVMELMNGFHYQQMDDEQKGEKVKKILQECLKEAKTEFLTRYGHEVEE